MSILHKIRQQPDHIRELIAGLCTIVVVVAIGFVWARSFDHSVYAMLNPSQEDSSAQPLFANISTPTSLFGYIGQGILAGKAEIFSLFDGSSTTVDNNNGPQTSSAPIQGQAHPLPVTGSK
ncbi:MAG TPA: hypothetical protein VFK07_01500 [Candidatus Paceibacterota bacterium]|nr:hypothetical protein [Candidatus Paceibacterota bacterium]